MTIVACTPDSWAATATPWPWLPAEAAITPRFRASSGRVRMRLSAPRSLYEPVRCRFSYLSQTRPPHSSENVRDSQHGVRCTRPSRRLAASWISWRLRSKWVRPGSGVGSRGGRLAQAVVAVVLDQALDHLLRQEQPLAAAAGAPFG